MTLKEMTKLQVDTGKKYPFSLKGCEEQNNMRCKSALARQGRFSSLLLDPAFGESGKGQLRTNKLKVCYASIAQQFCKKDVSFYAGLLRHGSYLLLLVWRVLDSLLKGTLICTHPKNLEKHRI